MSLQASETKLPGVIIKYYIYMIMNMHVMYIMYIINVYVSVNLTWKASLLVSPYQWL